MLGPLPKFYRVAVCAVALLLFVGAGAWVALVLPQPILVSAGAGVGLALGATCAYLLLHDSGPAAVPHHTPRRRLH